MKEAFYYYAGKELLVDKPTTGNYEVLRKIDDM